MILTNPYPSRIVGVQWTRIVAVKILVKIITKSVTLNGEVMNESGFDTGYGIWRLEQKDFELILAQSIVQKRHQSKILKNTPEITDNFWENLSMSDSSS